MFLGAVEIDAGTVYVSDNALVKQFNDSNIVIMEHDFIFHNLLNDSVIFTDSVFHIMSWNTAKKVSNKSIIRALVFEGNIALSVIRELLVNRVQYMYKMQNIDTTNFHTECKKSTIVIKTNIAT